MNVPFRDLKLQQVDKMLNLWHSAALPARPRSGWIKTIREALGISTGIMALKFVRS